jgi:hypothetical protein
MTDFEKFLKCFNNHRRVTFADSALEYITKEHFVWFYARLFKLTVEIKHFWKVACIVE